MKIYRILILIGILTPAISEALEIAIIDEGLNTTKTNSGNFYNPICVGAGDVWYARTNPNDPYTQNDRNVRIQDNNRVGMQRISLCENGFDTQTPFNAGVPRFRSLPPMGRATNGAPDIFREMVLLRSNLSTAHTFSTPYVNKRFGLDLVHGTNVATAAHRFNSGVRRKMIQVFSIAPNSTRTPALSCSVQAGSSMHQSSKSIGGTAPILRALREVIENPDGVDAINMSIVFRSAFCERARGNFIPEPCKPDSDNTGQEEVDALKALGISFVVGLENKDIGGQEVTWPACLDGVIKVGNNGVARDSIGVGAMGVDFFAQDTTTGGERGNSFAAPRIATAFAMLKEAVPRSTVEQQAVALAIANTREKTYRVGFGSSQRTFTRRDVRKTDIPQAIIELRELVRTNIDNIFFEDTNEYGPFYGGNNTAYSFNINFDQLIGSDRLASRVAQASQSLSLSTVRDVVLSFNGSSTVFNSQFSIYINGTRRLASDLFRGTRDFSFVLNRNLFREGNNTIEIRPFSNNWGLRNIKADFHPVVNLTVGQTNTNEYGYSHTPARFTGLRAVFDLPVVQGDYILSATGWDMDRADENEVFINGTSLGFLNQGSSSAYAPRNNFIIRSSLLEQGNNSIEFVQRRPGGDWQFFEDEKWAVRDIRIDLARPDLAVQQLKINDARLESSEPFNTTASIRNIGIGSSIVGSTARFYASSDKVINANDTLLKSVSFAALLENRSRVIDTSIQTSLVNQGLYFGVCVDTVPTESIGGNNCSKAIKLSNAPVTAPIIMMLLSDDAPPP